MTSIESGLKERTFQPYPFEFRRRQACRPEGPERRWPVVIIGGGIAGLTAALEIAAQGIRCVVLEADETVCFGSRAICFSRRTLEIFNRLGVARPFLEKGLAWAGGRSFHGSREVLRFSMPHDRFQKLPPMINLQQYYAEEYLVQAIERHADQVSLRWGSQVESVDAGDDGVVLSISDSRGRYQLAADWLIACDGARSLVRDAVGARLGGTSYEGRYVIVDIELRSDRATERLAWFDPPSNPGSTILMHKQPDDIWRIDYQLRDDEDPDAAVKPENVLPRVQAHLEMIGERGDWHPIWISIYKASALTLERYRHGRVLLAGDAAHLVPIFGVRGANSAIDDAHNLGWKLALVIQGKASTALLDSFSQERVEAARENLRQGMKSTEFMAPPSFAFRMMRQAVLELAHETPEIRSLINPRQTSAIAYSPVDSATADGALDGEEEAFSSGPGPGHVMECMPVLHVSATGQERASFLPDFVTVGQFLVLHFSTGASSSPTSSRLAAALRRTGMSGKVLDVVRQRPSEESEEYLLDPDGSVSDLYASGSDAIYLVRPDGYVLGRWRGQGTAMIEQAMLRYCGLAEERGR